MDYGRRYFHIPQVNPCAPGMQVRPSSAQGSGKPSAPENKLQSAKALRVTRELVEVSIFEMTRIDQGGLSTVVFHPTYHPSEVTVNSSG